MLILNALSGFGGRRRVSGGGGGYSFTLTAGDLFGFVQGYGVAAFIGSDFGSIDAEPVPGHALYLLLSGGENGITFNGNAAALLTGLQVYVGGVAYPFTGDDWTYDGGTGTTSGTWITGNPVFVDGNSYFVEIK